MTSHEASPEKSCGLKDYGTKYPQLMAPHIIDHCLQLGLDPSFIDFFEKQLNELHFVEVVNNRETTCNIDDLYDKNPAKIITPSLSIQSITNSNNGKAEVDPNDPPRVHALLVTLEDIDKRQELLESVFDHLDIKLPAKNGKQLLHRVATDWIFYELACQILGNACYMAQNFSTYKPDFDGQSPYYHADRSLSAAYLQQAGIVDRTDLKSQTIAEDTANLQKGFGLMMLHSGLLASELVRDTRQANWIIVQLRQLYPNAHRSEDIEARLSAIKPKKDVRSAMAQLSMSHFDPALVSELDEEDVDIVNDYS